MGLYPLLTFGPHTEVNDINEEDFLVIIILCDCTEVGTLVVRDEVPQDVVYPPHFVSYDAP